MRRLWGIIGLCLAATAVWADGDTESASTTLNVDIESAVTLSIGAWVDGNGDPSDTIVYTESVIENPGPKMEARYAPVYVRSNDEATLKISATNLAPADAESAGGPSVAPGNTMGDPVLSFVVAFMPTLAAGPYDSGTWYSGSATDYAPLSTTGVGVKQGANGGGRIFVLTQMGSQWEDAFAGKYSSTFTATLTAAAD